MFTETALLARIEEGEDWKGAVAGRGENGGRRGRGKERDRGRSGRERK